MALNVSNNPYILGRGLVNLPIQIPLTTFNMACLTGFKLNILYRMFEALNTIRVLNVSNNEVIGDAFLKVIITSK